MKRVLLISVVFLVSIMQTFAQTVTPKQGAKLHYMHRGDMDKFLEDKRNTYRPVVIPRGYKTVEITEPRELKILGYAASNNEVLYDLYIVAYNAHMAYLYADEASDRSDIDGKIETLQRQYDEVKNAPEILACKGAKERVKQQCQDSLDVNIERLNKVNSFIDHTVRIVANKEIENLEVKLMDKEAEMNKLEEQNKRALSTLKIIEARLSEGNSVGGHDVVLSYFNASDKVIKYLHWTAKIKNTVGDYVACETRNISAHLQSSVFDLAKDLV